MINPAHNGVGGTADPVPESSIKCKFNTCVWIGE